MIRLALAFVFVLGLLAGMVTPYAFGLVAMLLRHCGGL